MKKYIYLIIGSIFILSGCTLTKTPENTSNQNQIKNDNSQYVANENENVSTEKPQTNNSLDLSGQGLSKIPDYVFGQKKLEELNVSNNQLTGAIQAEIRQLQNLKILNASNNQMTGVPAEVGQLTKLEILDLSNNQLTGLPYELANLKNLKTLNLSGNSYSELDLSIIKKGLSADVNIIK